MEQIGTKGKCIIGSKTRKTTRTSNKKGWRGKGSGGAGLSKGLVSHIEVGGTVSIVATTTKKSRNGAAKKDKDKG